MSSQNRRPEPIESAEQARIQAKQGGHHLPPRAEKAPLDDTDRNSDKVIKPSQRP
jgi:hypothetical protein